MVSPDRQETEAVASVLVVKGARQDQNSSRTFFSRLSKYLETQGVERYNVTIDYAQLRVVTSASEASEAVPSLPNAFFGFFRGLAFQKGNSQDLTVLNDLSGQIQPGRLTLLLGPPSCGKTTFLKAIAGRPQRGYTGTIKYNGHDLPDFCAARTSSFVAQVDGHVGNLTARETAAFTNRLQKSLHDGPFAPVREDAGKMDANSFQLPPDIDFDSMSDAKFGRVAQEMLDGAGRVDLVMSMFGVARCADTWIGNAMVRGISGGERKRMSTVEMLMGHQRVQIFDEISTGLDSATLFRIISWLRAMCHVLQTTTVISLLQPPPETFQLFDDLILMAQGHIVYHGPLKQAVPFFQSLGFQLPPRKDVASFLQEVTTIKGQVMYSSLELKERCLVSPAIDTTDDEAMGSMDYLIPLQDMVDAFVASPFARDLVDGIENPAAKSMKGLVEKKHTEAQGFFSTLKATLGRQRLLMLRDKTLVRARIGQCIVIGLLIGSVFWDLGVDALNARSFLGAIFLSVMFMAFGGFPQLNVTIQNRGVWFKHRAMNLYSASSYAWAMTLIQLPLSIIEAVIYSLFVYFLVGFSTDGAKYYLNFCVILVTTSASLTSLFRLLGCMTSSPMVANSAAGITLLLLIVNSGFIIVREAIPPWIVYFYWLSPFAYSVRGLAINEFTSPRWGVTSPLNSQMTMGGALLDSFDFYDDRNWIYIGIAFNVAFVCVATQLTALALAVIKAPAQVAVIQSKEALAATKRAAADARHAAEAYLQKNPNVTVNITSTEMSTLEEERESGKRRSSTNNLAISRSLAFKPISLVWTNLEYYVTVPKGLTGPAAANIMDEKMTDDPTLIGKKRLLSNVTGYTHPGMVTALMGGTGAGKTTLMDVLAGRKTQGIIRGDLHVNGHPKNQDSWARVVGYVEQTDVHSAGLTVEESLLFSSMLRLDKDVAPEQRKAYLLEVLLVTELLVIRGNMVGSPGVSGLSVEQRRRLSIGVELVANPSVVFMDEPTSGLDARAAGAVMSAVRNVAGNGRTVMVTIHQPSIEIFESFDALVLLGMGGTVLYNGKLGAQSENLIKYFEAIPGVPPLMEGYNPATWMLEVSGGGEKMYVNSVDADFQSIYSESTLCKDSRGKALKTVAADSKANSPLTMSSLHAATLMRQISVVTWKQFILYWRTPSYIMARMVVTLIVAIIFGLTWWQEGKVPSDRPVEISKIQNVIGVMYSGMSFMGMTNLITGVPMFTAERQVAYRERASSMYSVLPFAMATGIVEVPYLILQSIIFVPISYFMIGFKLEFDAIAIFFIVFMQSISLYTFMGQLFTYLTASPALATVLGGLNHLLWNIFNGFLVPNPLMPSGWLWANYLSATTWVIYSLSVSQLGQEEAPFIAPGYPNCSKEEIEGCPSVKVFVEEYFGFEYSFRWWCVAILAFFIAVFRVGAMIVLKVVNHQHR